METVTFWRLVKERYALTAFDGYGARTWRTLEFTGA